MRVLSLALFILAAFSARADEAHSIDWYVAHQPALNSALLRCNVADGLIASQDCRNAITAARILAAQPQNQVSVENAKSPSL